MKVSYTHETPYPPERCCELLLHAFENQAKVRMAPNWIHAPHIVCGHISVSKIVLHRGDQLENPGTLIFTAAIVPCGDGSAIVGEFGPSRVQGFGSILFRVLTTFFLLGMPAFVAYGVYRDKSSVFTPALCLWIAIPIVGWIISLFLFRRFSRITADDMWVVKQFIEGATQAQPEVVEIR